MKNKTFPLKRSTAIGAVVVIVLSIVSYFVFQYALNDAISLVDVPFASKTILPHERIVEGDIVMKKIPKAYVEYGVLLQKKDILGKYVDLQSKVAKGSIFYTDMLKHEDDLTELPSLLLKEGQVAYPLSSDLLKSSGNTLSMNQKVDVYITFTDSKTKVTTVDRLLKNVRIIGLKDRNGLSLGDEKAQKIPAVILIAIAEEHLDYVKKANKIATIDLFAPRVHYGEEEESTLEEDCLLLELLKNE